MAEAPVISVGEQLPELIVPVSAKLIVGGAIASRDYQDVHHDKDAAQALGSRQCVRSSKPANTHVQKVR